MRYGKERDLPWLNSTGKVRPLCKMPLVSFDFRSTAASLQFSSLVQCLGHVTHHLLLCSHATGQRVPFSSLDTMTLGSQTTNCLSHALREPPQLTHATRAAHARPWQHKRFVCKLLRDIVPYPIQDPESKHTIITTHKP